MIQTIDEAVGILRCNALELQGKLDILVETALAAGEQPLAEQIAQQATDIAEVIGQLSKLSRMPLRDGPLPPASRDPSREERGMRIIFVEVLKMLATAQIQLGMMPPSDGTDTAQAQIDLLNDLLGRVRSLHHLAVDDVAELDAIGTESAEQ
jgi:hypothetical protein